MAELQKRIDTLLEASDNWLSNDNHYLMDAIDRTIREGYFSFEDVKYALKVIKESLDRDAVEEWAERAELDHKQENNASGQNVMCLHAGNLPLVGFQDAFATLLSGARYTGKVSRKDPYLLPTFLNEIKKTGMWTDRDVQWTHRLDDFEDMPHDAIIFAGSESSVPGVKQAIEEYNLAKDNTRYLIRTAHFSMAFFDRKDEKTIKNLVDGVLRYGGKGCRSVGIVVSPFSLEEIKDELSDYIRSFWEANPQHEFPPPKLRQQFAYNKAVERSQLWLEYLLLQEGGLEFDQDFVCYWVEGDESKVAELGEKYAAQLQSIYVAHPEVAIPGYGEQTEFLSNAQQPSLSWKPDGVDTLEWLIG
ncbi:hypothetical protein LQ318_01655 [Aliifodinibius salicampi]|uniref:Acyl-CoA reductase (LuxC) n=1 Tax=Fodinibius salicampi TaxID=1920655 RepID=A0ABT3PUR2_9BACT|nr:acyl-CoA reductase [Fodinibius salicampi]MCW9711596.1 hypothetical protein [Fodinibius salicampi]